MVKKSFNETNVKIGGNFRAVKREHLEEMGRRSNISGYTSNLGDQKLRTAKQAQKVSLTLTEKSVVIEGRPGCEGRGQWKLKFSG